MTNKLPDELAKELHQSANDLMEKFRVPKQNDHLHPWVAYRQGVLDGSKWMYRRSRAQAFRESAQMMDGYSAGGVFVLNEKAEKEQENN